MQYFVDLVIIGLTIGILYGLIALGISFIYSGLDMVHFAHGEMFMFGAFFAYSASSAGFPYPLALIAGAVGAGVLGIIVERLFYRRLIQSGGGLTVAGMGLIICGFGMSVALQNLAYLIWGPAPRNLPVDFGAAVTIETLSVPRTYLVIIVVSIILMLIMNFFLKHTRLGLPVRGVAHSKTTSYLMGINVPLAISSIFGIACGLAGAAGVLAAPVTYINVQMGAVILLKAFAAAVVGGLGSLPGAIFGGLIVGVTESLGSGYLAGEYKDVYSFILLLAILMLKPSGLLGVAVQEKA